MIKELYKEVIRETSLNVSENRIDSVRKKALTKCGCRVYKDGLIGVAGCFGEATSDTWERAEENLANGIPYPYEPEKNKERTRDLREICISDEQFIKDMEELLKILKKEYPQFIFSNKLQMTETETSLTNDAGLKLINYDKTLIIMLLVKHIDSVNIMDTAVIYISRKYDYNNFLEETRKLLNGYGMAAAIPDGEKVPVILCQADMLGKFTGSLNGESMALGNSMFEGRLNTRAFHEAFRLCEDRSGERYHVPFFDMEGTTFEEDLFPLIDGGIIKNVFTDKKSAATYKLPLTGAAGGGYDEVPTLSSPELAVQPGKKTLKELLNGETGILVVFASGGDYTDSGDYASPIQNSYLTDGENILGLLPELNISGNLYKMYGEDYIGCCSDKPFLGEHLLVMRMKIN